VAAVLVILFQEQAATVALAVLVSVVFIHGDYDDKQIRNY
jgi:hypothetical protein